LAASNQSHHAVTCAVQHQSHHAVHQFKLAAFLNLFAVNLLLSVANQSHAAILAASHAASCSQACSRNASAVIAAIHAARFQSHAVLQSQSAAVLLLHHHVQHQLLAAACNSTIAVESTTEGR